MRLDQIITSDDPATAADQAAAALEITGLAYDSRSVTAGELFFCVTGFERDGHEFAAQAIQSGARAIVVERPLGLGVPEVRVASVRAAMGPAAARFYDDPSRQLRVVGVTGTNGKTTTAFLVRAMIEAGGEQCGLLGTVTSVVGGAERPVSRTTAEAIDVQADFRAMLDGGDRACAMEISSHALQLGRADAIHCAAAIFTNLTQDHLDFHPTMEDYFLAKRRLFAPEHEGWRPAISVINVGDAYGRRLASELGSPLRFAVDAPADYSAHDVVTGPTGATARLSTPEGERELELAMPGRFNVANALGALAAVHSCGGDLDTLLATLARGVRVPGRMESVEEGQDFAVLVDYAHTPDSLENVLRAARELTRGRVVCVFGAGGDRDRAKRPVMGVIAARLAEQVFVTSDNPRSEDPDAIIEAIMEGVRSAERPPGSQPAQAIEDRRRAIVAALACAQPGEVVLIAGKGHEQGQEIAGGHKLPFDDVTVAREALRLLASGALRSP